MDKYKLKVMYYKDINKFVLYFSHRNIFLRWWKRNDYKFIEMTKDIDVSTQIHKNFVEVWADYREMQSTVEEIIEMIKEELSNES